MRREEGENDYEGKRRKSMKSSFESLKVEEG